MTKPAVLFVDDELFHSRQYINAMRDHGFEIATAASVDEALSLASSQRFAAVVLDIMMPSGDFFDEFETAGGYHTGVALARELRERIPDAVLLGLSLSTDPSVEEWFKSQPQCTLLNKHNTTPSRAARVLARLMRGSTGEPEIFLVHGRDQKTLDEVRALIADELELGTPYTLSDQISAGQTIIEKLEKYVNAADVVVVLLTPDDVGYLASDPQGTRRARQNVIFECGYVLGLLRRSTGRVLLLHKGPLEIPSDLYGIVYVDISEGLRKAQEEIARELRAALHLPSISTPARSS